MQELITKTVPTGVSVVTVRSGDKINGMTAALNVKYFMPMRLEIIPFLLVQLLIVLS